MSTVGKENVHPWEQFSHEIGASFIKEKLLTNKRVIAHIGNWEFVLDTHRPGGQYSSTCTRIRAPYRSLKDFNFTILRKNFISKALRFLNTNEVKSGYPDIDYNFLIGSSSANMITKLFSSDELRKLISNQPKFYLSTLDDEGLFRKHFPKDVHELYFSVSSIIEDIEQLKKLYEIFGMVLKELHTLEFISDEAVRVKLNKL